MGNLQSVTLCDFVWPGNMQLVTHVIELQYTCCVDVNITVTLWHMRSEQSWPNFCRWFHTVQCFKCCRGHAHQVTAQGHGVVNEYATPTDSRALVQHAQLILTAFITAFLYLQPQLDNGLCRGSERIPV